MDNQAENKIFPFLVMLLLLSGKSNTFNKQIQIIKNQTSQLKNIIELFSKTAENFQSVFNDSQKSDDFNLQ